MSGLFITWQKIKQRCFNPKNMFYSSYGGRGITMCKEWEESFEQFSKDVGPKPADSLTLDRKDNDGNYEPSNVRWATIHEQNGNRRNLNKVPGVLFCKQHRSWRVRITILKKQKQVGYYTDWFEAVCARKSAENKYLGELYV